MKLLILPTLLAILILAAKSVLGLPVAGLLRHLLIDTVVLFFLSLGIYKLANTTWLFPNRSNAPLTVWDRLFGLEDWVRTPAGSWRNFSGAQIFGLVSLGLTLGYLVLRIYPVVLAKDEALAVINKNSPKEIAAEALHQCAMPMGMLQTSENFHYFLHPKHKARLYRACSALQKEAKQIAKGNKILYVEWNAFSPAFQNLEERDGVALVTFAADQAKGIFDWEKENTDGLSGEQLQQLFTKKVPLKHARFTVELERHEGAWRISGLPEKIFTDS